MREREHSWQVHVRMHMCMCMTEPSTKEECHRPVQMHFFIHVYVCTYTVHKHTTLTLCSLFQSALGWSSTYFPSCARDSATCNVQCTCTCTCTMYIASKSRRQASYKYQHSSRIAHIDDAHAQLHVHPHTQSSKPGTIPNWTSWVRSHNTYSMAFGCSETQLTGNLT